jgi:hypothetical protein
VIYLNDHPPPHVHVKKSGKQARVGLSPVELWDSDLSPGETRQAVAIVEENHDTLIASWQEMHGDSDEINFE